MEWRLDVPEARDCAHQIDLVVQQGGYGNQVQILEGLKEGDEVVTSGQMKLKNGTQVTINNSVVPANNPEPVLPNEH